MLQIHRFPLIVINIAVMIASVIAGHSAEPVYTGAAMKFFNDPLQMEPLLPPLSRELTDLTLAVTREAGKLCGLAHVLTQESLKELVHNMNSYYSNLIEGHRTHPYDIERALKKDLSADPRQRALQIESKAHVEVQNLIDARLRDDPETKVCGAEFIRWIHKEFCARLPKEFLSVKDPKTGKALPVRPGEFRDMQVEIGRHVPPAHTAIEKFLKRFEEAYEPAKLSETERIIAAAASHHRLAWIHPFLDGNGRVTRLYTHAYLRSTKVNGQGLWTISRGMARDIARYMDMLAYADEPRLNDLDGRGNLSQKALAAFCKFFLETALDQLVYMGSLLDMDNLQPNIARYVSRHQMKPEVATVLGDLVYRGRMERGDVAARLKLKPSQARIYIRQLLDDRLLVSDSPKGPVRLGFPVHCVADFFPKLYPAEVEFELEAKMKRSRELGGHSAL
jgi:Fic family protein